MPGPEAVSTNWNTEGSIGTSGITFLLWGWPNTGTGYPQRLWSLHPWRYLQAVWTRSWAAGCRWPCLSRGGGPDNLQRSLPTTTILWNKVTIGVEDGHFRHPSELCQLWKYSQTHGNVTILPGLLSWEFLECFCEWFVAGVHKFNRLISLIIMGSKMFALALACLLVLWFMQSSQPFSKSCERIVQKKNSGPCYWGAVLLLYPSLHI